MTDDDDDDQVIVRDSNGTILSNGDTIFAIKDLKIKGSSAVIKRGTVVKNIRLTNDPKLVEGNTGKLKNMVFEVQYFKKG
jgi:protein PhnA